MEQKGRSKGEKFQEFVIIKPSILIADSFSTASHDSKKDNQISIQTSLIIGHQIDEGKQDIITSQSQDISEKIQIYNLYLLRSPQSLRVDASNFDIDNQYTGQNISLERGQYVFFELEDPGSKQFDSYLNLIKNGMIVYQSLFYQLNVNKFNTQAALILDGSLIESQIAIEILTNAGVGIIATTVDSYEVQRELQERYPELNLIFTPTENIQSKAAEFTDDVGFDLIVDYNSFLQPSNFRAYMKLMNVLAKIITTSKSLQIDPPESAILNQLSATLAYVNNDTFIKSKQFDGVIMSMIESIIQKCNKQEFKIKFEDKINLAKYLSEEVQIDDRTVNIVFDFESNQ